MSPARRRDAVRFLVKRRRVSERRACRVVGQHRSTQRYERVAADYELRLLVRMNELAAAHPRYGSRRIWALLRSEGWRVNRKRIERLWRLEGHRVPPRRSRASGSRARGTAEKAIWNLPATRPNHVWSYDFMGSRTRDGAPIRILNVVDEYTRLAVGCRVARSIGAGDVINELERLSINTAGQMYCVPTTAASSSPKASAPGSPSRASRQRSSRRAARSKTRSSSASTAPCATNP